MIDDRQQGYSPGVTVRAQPDEIPEDAVGVAENEFSGN
jgi:hypothetical protein